MKEPNIRIEELFKLEGIATKLSTLDREGVRPTTFRTHYAEEIYNSFILHLKSLIRLLPEKEENPILVLDPSSLATITRMIIEIHNVFQYLCEKGIEESEFKFRIWLYDFHYHTQIIKILNQLEFDDNATRNFWLTASSNIAERELKNNAFFKSLDSKTQNDLLKGKKAYFWKSYNPKNRPLPKHVESAIYNLLSNSVHSFPLGISNQRSINSGHLNTESLLFITTEAAIIYSASLTKSYVGLRAKLTKELTIEERKYVKQLSKSNQINKWISYREWYSHETDIHQLISENISKPLY
jgi:hypothetical protein